MTQDKIEILSVELLETHRPLTEHLKKLAANLSIELGWHYLLDLIWIISQLEDLQGKTILDAGAGTGLLQWYLAEAGAHVISVDRQSRAYLPLHLRTRFRAQGLREKDLAPLIYAVFSPVKGGGALYRQLAVKTKQTFQSVLYLLRKPPAHGRVTIYHQDLSSLDDIATGCMDVVVAVSALEHNPPEKLPLIVGELMRTLKPDGLLLATLTAAHHKDWFHQPSQGWCYTEATLRKLFDLDESATSNYADYESLFTMLRENAELRDHLASFYFKSGDNGMPWGKWDPQYQPVGVRKFNKPTARA